jgi:hypothetical protein
LAPPFIPLQFAPVPAISNGWIHVRLLGAQKSSVAVEGSANLTNWTRIAANTLPAGGLPLAMPMGTNRQFFRARIP